MHAVEPPHDEMRLSQSPPSSARFTDKRVHLFKEVAENAARSFCGLSERGAIWRQPGSDVTCQRCARHLGERGARPS